MDRRSFIAKAGVLGVERGQLVGVIAADENLDGPVARFGVLGRDVEHP